MRLDPRANAEAHDDADVSAGDDPVRTVVVTAREDVEIAHETRALISSEIT